MLAISAKPARTIRLEPFHIRRCLRGLTQSDEEHAEHGENQFPDAACLTSVLQRDHYVAMRAVRAT